MGVDSKMLGSRGSPTPTSAANFVWLVSVPALAATMCWPDETLPRSGTPAWKRLIDRPLAADERITLITAIFSDRNETEVVRRLCGDDAQRFVDVIDEVFRRSSVRAAWTH